MVGQQLDKYSILSVLGEGGMATVYLAENTNLRQKVALKVLKEDFVRDRNVRNRFIAEAKNMSQIKHPNIVQVYDLIDAGDIVAIVMEYIEDLSLKQYLEKNKNLKDSEIKKLLTQMLTALEHIHDAGFVHRDIKPSNFLMCKKGVIKLTDFGIAKNVFDTNLDYTGTGTGVQLGTPLYMSPEQIRDAKSVDARSDIYSLGVVLFEMVHGNLAQLYNTLSIPEIQVSILKDPLPKTNTKWDIFIFKATEKHKEFRYVNCQAWKSNLAILDVMKREGKTNFSPLINLPEKQTPISDPWHTMIAMLISLAVVAILFFILFTR
jgi:serine/threonine-protein kinase